MMKKMMLASVAFALSMSAMAGVEYYITGKQEITYKKVASNKFEKISVIHSGKESLTAGSKVLFENQLTIPDDNKLMSLEITKSGTVKFLDISAGVEGEVEAKIEKSFFGRVKSVTIDNEKYQFLYEKAIQQSGVGIIKKLNLGNVAEVEYVNSSFECKEVAGKDLLKCEVESAFTVSF